MGGRVGAVWAATRVAVAVAVARRISKSCAPKVCFRVKKFWQRQSFLARKEVDDDDDDDDDDDARRLACASSSFRPSGTALYRRAETAAIESAGRRGSKIVCHREQRRAGWRARLVDGPCMVGALLLPDVSRGEERRPVPVIARDGWPAPPLAALANLAAFQVRVC